MTLDSDLDLDFKPPPPLPKKNLKNRGLPSMMINTHVKFESNRAIRT